MHTNKHRTPTKNLSFTFVEQPFPKIQETHRTLLPNSPNNEVPNKKAKNCKQKKS
jgi:hypothetical protein